MHVQAYNCVFVYACGKHIPIVHAQSCVRATVCATVCMTLCVSPTVSPTACTRPHEHEHTTYNTYPHTHAEGEELGVMD